MRSNLQLDNRAAVSRECGRALIGCVGSLEPVTLPIIATEGTRHALRR